MTVPQLNVRAFQPGGGAMPGAIPPGGAQQPGFNPAGPQQNGAEALGFGQKQNPQQDQQQQVNPNDIVRALIEKLLSSLQNNQQAQPGADKAAGGDCPGCQSGGGGSPAGGGAPSGGVPGGGGGDQLNSEESPEEQESAKDKIISMLANLLQSTLEKQAAEKQGPSNPFASGTPNGTTPPGNAAPGPIPGLRISA